MQNLGGAQEGFSLAESELDQACRFMLVREPRVVVDPIDAGARVAQEGAPRPPPPGPNCSGLCCTLELAVFEAVPVVVVIEHMHACRYCVCFCQYCDGMNLVHCCTFPVTLSSQIIHG